MSPDIPGGPYVVRTVRLERIPGDSRSLETTTQQAFATLDEARKGAFKLGFHEEHWPELNAQLMALPVAGGSLELPDGTMITVEQASWDDLVGPEGWGASTTVDEVVAAANARFAKHDAQENGGVR